jgi:ribosomal protein S18 acetylase RimI-like enzyme
VDVCAARLIRQKPRRNLWHMDIEIREARPEDREFLAWVMLTAARSHVKLCFWDLAFPGPEQPRLETIADFVTAEPTNFANYDGFLVAEREGQPVAALSAYDSASKSLENFTTAMAGVLAARGWSADHMALLGARIASGVACMPDSPEGTWVIEWVAAKPEARGKGVARRLLTEILERGRAAGYSDVQISVLMGNTPAQTAYERVGFAAVEDLTDPGFEATFGSPGITRMTQKL